MHDGAREYQLAGKRSVVASVDILATKRDWHKAKLSMEGSAPLLY